MDVSTVFQSIRDIPYVIPLSLGEVDRCCRGKHRELKELFTDCGFQVRYRVCSFLWSSIDLPKDVCAISHDDLSSHVYLEVLINAVWTVVDATWDIGLISIFHINHWEDIPDMYIAVQPLKIYTPEKSNRIMREISDQLILDDLHRHGPFYHALNQWFDDVRRG